MPVWLGAEDHAWLRALIDDFIRLEGRPYFEVASFFQEPPRIASPPGKRQMAIWTLENMSTRQPPPIDAIALRDAVVVEAQRARDAGRFNRADIVAIGAQQFGLAAQSIDELLFADLPGERRLRPPNPIPDPHSLASRTNLALAQGLLRIASEVSIELFGGARAVVRQVHLRRLLCIVRRRNVDGVRLDISGAFSLFRHTTMYGHALASILPLLPWCNRFNLNARCMLRGRSMSAHLRSGDPIALGEPPKAYDSRLEERFARDFARATLDWDLVREPEPIETGDALVFPDFAITHRRETSKRFLLEIVGFWTPEYLRDKLDRLRCVSCAPLVLCIDRGLNCGSSELPPHARVVWFQKRINPKAVLEVIENWGRSPLFAAGL
jgi:predicted nuclease of restriction endonuclease-like RecB superfamily